MKPPIFMRPLTDAERPVVAAGLRSSAAFVLRRCQILLASARGERPPWLAQQLGCASQTVRNAIRAFNERGLDALSRGSTTPKRVRRVFAGQHAADLKALLHQGPRQFGKDTSVGTLDLAADVSFEQGLTPTRVSDETVRQAHGRRARRVAERRGTGGPDLPLLRLSPPRSLLYLTTARLIMH